MSHPLLYPLLAVALLLAVFLVVFIVLCYYGATRKPEETAYPPKIEDSHKESQP